LASGQAGTPAESNLEARRWVCGYATRQ